MPDEIRKMVDSVDLVKIGQKGISTLGTNILDYGIVYFSKPENYISAMLAGNEPRPDAMALWFLVPVKDEQGNVVDYNGELFGVVYSIENVRWFKNVKAKEVFEKAIN